MSYSLRGAVAAVIAVGALSAFSVSIQAAPPAWAEGRILVQPQAGLPEAVLQKLLEKHGSRIQARIDRLGIRVVTVPPKAEEAIARALAKHPHIQFAERDALVAPGVFVPNDPKYSSAWHLPKIGTPSAWDISQGAGVTVAILDSGVDPTHPDLVAQMVPGWNSVDSSTNTADIFGHGTKVAGTVAAATHNSIGVAGVAGMASLMPIRVSNRSDGYAYWSDIARGLTWAADHGALVANISYSASGSSTIKNAAQYLRNKGGLTVVAAGNDGNNPGFAENTAVISVAATQSNDTRASWSNFGDYVDISAPGVGIWTTQNGGTYGAPSGTSFASPVTAGVVALIMSANPTLSPDDVEQILTGSADDLGTAGWDQYYGEGRVNATRAVQMALSAQPADSQPPTATVTSPSAGSTVKDTVTVAVNALDNVGVARVDLYAGSTLVGSDLTVPYGFAWDTTTVSDGSVTLSARAYDSAGNLGQSAGVTVKVSNAAAPVDTTAPTVQITSPSSGATVSGTVNIQASASDNVAVTVLKIYVDGVLSCAGNAATLSCPWNTRNATKGSHTLNAVAADAAGNSRSSSLSVTVGGRDSGTRGSSKK